MRFNAGVAIHGFCVLFKNLRLSLTKTDINIDCFPTFSLSILTKSMMHHEQVAKAMMRGITASCKDQRSTGDILEIRQNPLRPRTRSTICVDLQLIIGFLPEEGNPINRSRQTDQVITHSSLGPINWSIIALFSFQSILVPHPCAITILRYAITQHQRLEKANRSIRSKIKDQSTQRSSFSVE